MGAGGEIIAGRGWWRRKYGWSWVVVGGDDKITLVAGGRR